MNSKKQFKASFEHFGNFWDTKSLNNPKADIFIVPGWNMGTPYPYAKKADPTTTLFSMYPLN